MLKDAGRLWDIIGIANRKRFYLVLAMVVVMALLDTAGVLSVTPFLATLGSPDIIYRNPFIIRVADLLGIESQQGLLAVLGLFSIAIVVCAALFKSVTLHLLNRYVQFQRYYISSRLLRVYLRLPYSFHLLRNSSDLSKTIISEVDQLINGVLQPFMLLLAHGTLILAITCVLLIYDPVIALVVVGCLGVLYGAIFLVVRGVLDKAGRERLAANRRRHRSCAEALGGVKEVKAMNASGLFLDRFSKASRQFSRHVATIDTLSQSPLYLVECLGISLVVGLSLILVLRGQDLGQVLPTLGLYAFAAYRMLPASQNVYRGITRMRSGAAALRHLHSELGQQEESTAEESDLAGESRHQLVDAISLRDVSFHYLGADNRQSLSGINLQIKALTSVGIIGSTGAGKSTLIDLLLGLLSPDEGQVCIDDVPLSPRWSHIWRENIGYVPQQIFLTDATIAENIAFGVPAERIDMSQVENAARMAQLHEFICDSLPQGYETEIGERGVRISGGERQRLGLARALYRDPQLLLLDEATSALDVAVEESVLASMDTQKGRRTIIMIAHRLSAVENCDAVVLLHEGKVEMIGSPASVIAHARELWRGKDGEELIAKPAATSV